MPQSACWGCGGRRLYGVVIRVKSCAGGQVCYEGETIPFTSGGYKAKAERAFSTFPPLPSGGKKRRFFLTVAGAARAPRSISRAFAQPRPLWRLSRQGAGPAARWAGTERTASLRPSGRHCPRPVLYVTRRHPAARRPRGGLDGDVAYLGVAAAACKPRHRSGGGS